MERKNMLMKKAPTGLKVSSSLHHLKRKKMQALASRLKLVPRVRVVESANVEELEKKINMLVGRGYYVERLDVVSTDFFQSFLCILVYEPYEEE